MINKASERIGTKIEQKNGHTAICIEYINGENCTFEYETGIKITGYWSTFVRKGLSYPGEAVKSSRIGTVIMQNCGMNAKCIAYRSFSDCDFIFPDGKIKTNRTWDAFKKGNIAYIDKNEIKEERIGKCIKQNNGLIAKCIEYNNGRDCLFIFEDLNYTVRATWKAFKEGLLSTNERLVGDEHIGVSIKQKNGDTYTCINKSDQPKKYVFKSENGRVVTATWTYFKKGFINPVDINQRKGTVIHQKCGYDAECIEYRSSTDCIFVIDGISIAASWIQFKRGQLIHPDKAAYLNPDNRLGMVRQMRCGLNLKCINYKSATDCDFEFEDGEKILNSTWVQFDRLNIKHPSFTSPNNGIFHGYEVKRRFEDGDNVYYSTINLKTGEKDIKTLREILKENE